jgi:hypothetical protein
MARKRKRPNPKISKDPFRRYEPLREELRKYVEVCGGVRFLRHPFCNESIADLDKCGWIHDCLDERVAKYDECFEAHDYEGCLNCIDIYFQPEWLAKDVEFLPDDRYWTLLSRVYQTQRVTLNYRDLFDEMFRSDRPGRELLMSEDERAILDRLPKRLRVYRGYRDEDLYADGVAWTLDRRQAIWWANFGPKNCDLVMLASGTISKDRIWAYFEGGDILLPSEEVRNRRDEDALDPAARVAWQEFISPKFDVTTLLKK